MLKSLFNGSSEAIETDNTPSQPRLSDAEYESVLFALLAAIKKGRSWGSCQGFLISRNIKPDQLAEWIEEKSLEWLNNADNYQQLGQDLEELGNIASGKLGNLARNVSSELGVRGSELGNFQENNLQNTESNPTPPETENITPSQTTTDEVQRLIDQSIEQYQKGEYQEAVNSVVGITQQYPNDYRGWYYLGELMSTFQQYEQAIASFDKALQLKPDDHQVWNNRGNALFNLGRFDEAIASYDKALQLKPDFHEAWNNRGIALGNLGRFDEAIASYDKALQLKPDFHEAWNNRGIAASLSTASEGYILRVESQFIDTFQLELTDASRQLINYFQSLETGDFGDLISFLQQPNSDKLIQFLNQSQLQSISRLNPELNIRGYEGRLISYRYPLNKHIYQDSHPEGWGYLHHKIGVAQYKHQEYYNAINSYHCALETLTIEQFPELRLEVIQDLVKVYLAKGDKDNADDYLFQGLQLLNQLLDQVPIEGKNQRLRLEAKFLTFRQLTVNVLLEKGEIIEALRNSELEKNRRLTHILEGYKTENKLKTTSNIYPSYEQIQSLLTPEKAIIYWFNSPMGLITFIIKQNELIPLNLSKNSPLTKGGWGDHSKNG
ncbi:TPR domain protein, putative component of TonB system [Crocosphaera watsonii WH 0402]|uniref:TPR domain protein, putative component of TonB system n=1 Tax=Crocosphaera watsonii WH 0402 TaxID=1284629 RepID=T2JSM4_CROWT|nr:tetratricopeptide repeat protein [Crocosphaera watsonii]CCQ67597.1 TPR domain protein, putative component of TonB system [Crocosphaera watsonii WH 0402]